ncbi:S8 family serine peptidase [Neobacillus drentensis]|uniref:S8 family serine peptidase n=1 Tax=Neobacillus drentensis TaxID=220684 RepID=UPI002FFDDBF4
MTKRQTRKRFLNGIAAFALLSGGLGVTATSISPLSTVHANENLSAETILNSLSDKQLAALHKLQTSEQSGLHLDPNVNLEGSEPVNVIVQFHALPATTAVASSEKSGKTITLSEAKEKVNASHHQFKKDLDALSSKTKKSASSPITIKHSFKEAFNGVSMSLPANEIEKLLDSQTVKAIWSDVNINAAPPIEKENEKAGIAINPSHGTEPLHTEGYTGEGIKVAVIDTGIDYNHPDLKDAYKGGYDFVDNDADPMETTYDDWKKSGWPEINNGSSYYTSHGTHVAGIIAGQGINDHDYGVKGVSPGVDLYAYRVLGQYGSGLSSHIIAAIDKAVSEGMDIMNLSLGANINDPFYPTSIAINNAVLAGVTAVVAAGNNGSEMKTLGAPGTSTLALTVGANDMAVTLPTFTGGIAGNGSSTDVDLRLLGRNVSDNISLLEGNTLSIVDVGLGQPSNYVGKDVKGKAVLISRGETSFDEKIKLAKDKAAAAVLLYNNNESEGHIPYYIGETVNYIPAFSLNFEDGVSVKEQLALGEAFVTFTGLGNFTMEGGNLADFSSRGPSRVQYEIKPEVTAPGVQVLSTVPSYANGAAYIGNYDSAYQQLSGTSMASPYVAGIAALLLQQDPALTPDDVRTILMNTADPLSKNYSVFEAGSGQVDANEALHSQIEIMVENPSVTITNGEEQEIMSKSGALNFGASLHTGKTINKSRAITLKNQDKKPKTFEVTADFQVGMGGSRDANKNGVSLQVDKKIMTVPGNKEKGSNISIVVPPTAEAGTYEGFVTYQNKHDKNEVYRIPFAFAVTEEGFREMKTDPKVMTSSYTFFYPYVAYQAGVRFTSKSVMETIDFVLLDGETDKELGFLGRLEASALMEDIEYYVTSVFQGSYFPYTGDPDQPISESRIKVPYGPGHYKVKMIGTNKEGKTFPMSDHVMMDITGPEFQTDIEEGVIEYKPGTTSYPIKGTLIDKNYSDYKNQGIAIDQSGHFVMEKSNSFMFTNQIFVDAEGEFAYNIPIDPSAKSVNVELQGFNTAGIGKEIKSFTFVQEGSPYVYGSLNNKNRKMGDEVKITLTANNISEAKNLAASFTFDKNLLEVVDVKIHPDLKQFGNAEILSESVSDGYETKLNVNVALTDGKVSGDIPFAEVILNVKNDSHEIITYFNSPTASFINENNETTSMVSAVAPILIVPSYSKISGTLAAPKPFQRGNSTSWNLQVDPSQLGAFITVKDQKGKEYAGTINRYAQIEVGGLPPALEEMELTVDIPGHFTVYKPFHVGYLDDNGNITAHWNPELDIEAAIPGDVNKDDVIDVRDAIYLELNWGTNERRADINFDKMVDAKDMKYIQDHYLMKNQTASTTPEPKEIHEGKTLEDILAKLGSN